MPTPSKIAEAELITVDWGTTRLRASLVDADGTVIDKRESDEGIGGIAGEHGTIFDRLVSDWPTAPSIMAGMVGSRQGWREAPYVACPATPAKLADQLLRFDSDSGRPIGIVPGMMLPDTGRGGDVIRGEETQAVGLIDAEPNVDAVAIFPGTHSKWVRISDGSITDFQTFMSGEMFDLLSRKSFLRHSVADGGRDLSGKGDFALGVGRVAEQGLPFVAAVFSVRARQLLSDVAPADNLAYLSGLIVGGEIAAARDMGLLEDKRLHIVGSETLNRAYKQALHQLGFDAVSHNGRDLVSRGLLRLAAASGFANVGRSHG